MVSLALRWFLVMSVLAMAANGAFLWRWPAAFGLVTRRPRHQVSATTSPAADDMAEPSPVIAWVVLITIMALLIGGWLLLMLL